MFSGDGGADGGTIASHDAFFCCCVGDLSLWESPFFLLFCVVSPSLVKVFGRVGVAAGLPEEEIEREGGVSSRRNGLPKKV